MILVFYALFYVMCSQFYSSSLILLNKNLLELSAKEERKLVNGEDPLTRDFLDPLYEEFEESS